MNGSVVISGPPAVGKTTLARSLARELNLLYVSGGDILKEMAAERGFRVGGEDWWDTAEGMRFLSARDKDASMDKDVDRRLLKMCRAGGVVVTSYTLPWLGAGALSIWLEGSHENSARRMRARDDMTEAEALAVTRDRYERNRALYRSMYGFEFGLDRAVFDGIVETDGLDADQVLARALELVGGRT